jgi:hypothetical protein
MAIGVVLPASTEEATGANKIDILVALGREAAEVGLGSVWVSQQFDHDALSVAAILGSAVPGIALGTSVVPIYPRHPIVVSSQGPKTLAEFIVPTISDAARTAGRPAPRIVVSQTGVNGGEDRRRTCELLGELNRSRVSAG